MLFAITLSYTRPLEEIQAHLEAHKEWLFKYAQAEAILFAGPLQQGKGGFILAHGEDLAGIQKMIADDPFNIHRLATFEVDICDPAIRAHAFPQQWATNAKPV